MNAAGGILSEGSLRDRVRWWGLGEARKLDHRGGIESVSLPGTLAL